MKWDASDAKDPRVLYAEGWYHIYDVPLFFPQAYGVFVFATLSLQVDTSGLRLS